MTDHYFEEVDDGLAMRESQDYAKDKLNILKGYIFRFTTSMRNKKWRALNYIDLEAGPGKNIFSPSKSVMLGSPLIALSAPHPFTNYRFVELKTENFQALQKRVSASDRIDRVKIFHGDCNLVVDDIVEEIRNLDSVPLPDKWSCLNLAFLDPEGLELHWQTVEKLGRMSRMDLIINFSTSGFTRNKDQMLGSQHETALDRFFGTDEWKKVYREVADKDITVIRRTMLDFYKQRLTSLGYKFNFERDITPGEKVFRNSRGAQVYTLMFASKHDLGIKFWNDAIDEAAQPRLF